MAESPVEDYCVRTLAALSEQFVMLEREEERRDEDPLDSYRDFGRWIDPGISSQPPSRCSPNRDTLLRSAKNTEKPSTAIPRSHTIRPSATLFSLRSKHPIDHSPKQPPLHRKASSEKIQKDLQKPSTPSIHRFIETFRNPYPHILSATGSVPLQPVIAAELWRRKKRMNVFTRPKDTVKLRRKPASLRGSRGSQGGESSPSTPFLYLTAGKVGTDIPLTDLIKRRLSLYPSLQSTFRTAHSPTLRRPHSEHRLQRKAT